MRTTIKDIARYTGLSVTTVSLALRSDKGHRLSDKTIKLVRKAARELNYRPNQLAVGLITQKTKTIGLIIPDIENHFFTGVAKGAETSCQNNGYNILFSSTNDNPKEDLTYLQVMMDWGVDGIIFSMAANTDADSADKCLKMIGQSGVPVILLDRKFEENCVTSVLIDHEMGGYLATNHLLELGHRRIGCITGPMGLITSRERMFGYIHALQSHEICMDSSLVVEGDYKVDSGYRAAKQLHNKGVDAIFACNDMMAFGVYKYMYEQGLSVPKDLSVVGFDNASFSDMIMPPLTTIHQPIQELGHAAVRKLLQLINEPGSVCENEVFQPELVIRDSTRKS